MNFPLAQELISMAHTDVILRKELASDGSLFGNYHPRMKAVHDSNAKRLSEIVATYGWPGKEMVGEKAAHAAWLILQHAIAHPDLQRDCFPMLVKEVEGGMMPSVEVAMLEDRIRCFEGRPQRFGTQFDWDEQGKMSPLPMDDPEQVELRRKRLGMPSLQEEITKKRKEITKSKEKPPADYSSYIIEKEKWLQENGWRHKDQ